MLRHLLLLLLLLFTIQLRQQIINRQILLLMTVQHDQNAITVQIWRELSNRLRQFVAARVNSSADVDDILQTVFLRIHSSVDKLRESDRLESWVFQITRNAVNDHFRKQRLSNSDDVESLTDHSQVSKDENMNQELAGCLGSFIEKLPTDQRRALSLYEFDRHSQQQIAEIEGISLSAAKSRIQRARKSLECMLKACCEFQFDHYGNVLEYQSAETKCCNDKCE